MYGGVGENIKGKFIASIGRFVEILKTTARISLGIEFKGPMRIDLIKKGGIPLHYEVESMNENIFRELLEAKSFKIEFDVLPTGKIVRGGYPSHLLFWYDEEKNLGNSINVDIITNYPESVLGTTFFGLLVKVNLIKLTGFRGIAESLNKRVQDLWESVLRLAFGGNFTKTERRFQLRKYEPETLLVHLFGKYVRVKD